MKKIIYYTIGILALCSSCKKGSSPPAGNAALNVINATLDVPSFYVYFTLTPSNYFLQQNPVTDASSGEYGIPAGNQPVSIISSTDSVSPLIQSTYKFTSGGIYSFYLFGQVGSYDTLLMQDQLPVYSDSSAGVRFINLASGSPTLSVNIAGNPGIQTEFSNLGYKQISLFKAYPATSIAGASYNFEIRNQGNDSLLTTFTWNFGLQKSNTVVISGLITEGLTIFQINNY